MHVEVLYSRYACFVKPNFRSLQQKPFSLFFLSVPLNRHAKNPMYLITGDEVGGANSDTQHHDILPVSTHGNKPHPSQLTFIINPYFHVFSQFLQPRTPKKGAHAIIITEVRIEYKDCYPLHTALINRYYMI